MKCPFCHADNDKVIDSRASEDGSGHPDVVANATAANGVTRLTSGSNGQRFGS